MKDTYRFITFNIWGDYFGNPPEERDEALAAVVLRHGPDIVALQEVTPNFWKSRLFQKFDAGGYGCVRTDERDAVRRAGGTGGEGFVNHVPLLYRRDRFRLVAAGYDVFHLRLTDNKGVTWAVLEDMATGIRLIAFSTHFWYQANGPESEAIRELNAAHCVELLAKVKALYGDLPVVGGGDLNTFSPRTSGALALFRRRGYDLAAEVAASADRRCTHHGDPVRGADGRWRGSPKCGNDTSDHSLDHILVEHGCFVVSEHRIIRDQDALDASDHSPVLVDFSIA